LQRRSKGFGVGGLAAALAIAGYLWTLAGVALVAMHWGGDAALRQTLPAIAALLLAAAMASRSHGSTWPSDLRWQGNTVAALLVAGGVVAAISGGAYLGNRFSTSGNDLDGRLRHWQLSLSMLRGTEDLILGRGLGRYVENYAIMAPEDLRPGDYRIRDDGDNPYVTLLSGRRMTDSDPKSVMAFSDMLRLSQRIALPLGLLQVRLSVRTAEAATLDVSVCTKHLLYVADCIGREFGVKAQPGVWQPLQFELQGKPLSRGDWYAPKLVVFTVGIDSSNRQVDVDNLSLTDRDGIVLLSNGDFSSGMAHWFTTSDHSHLPWHIKNLPLNVAFDQGLTGLLLLTALGVGALCRLCLGSARDHILAPCLAGGLMAFATVGLFDSLLDVPRIAFLFYWLLALALAVRPKTVESQWEGLRRP
jgi:hypothetical protein